MRVYWRIFVFYYQRFLAYPWEVFALVFRRILSISFLVIFWTVVSQTAGSDINMRELLAYFLIASTLSGWVMATRFNYGQFLNSLIKRGEMSIFLIRPASVVPSTFAASFGIYGVDLLLGLVAIAASWVIVPPAGAWGTLLFLLFLLPALGIATAMNLAVGTMSFWTVEASSIRHCVTHVSRVFSGSMIPLAFFPGTLKVVADYMPFGFMVSSPVTALRISSLTAEVGRNLALSYGWAVALMFLALRFWNISLKRYEAVGI